MGPARTWKPRISAGGAGRRVVPLTLTAFVVACGGVSANTTRSAPVAAGPASVASAAGGSASAGSASAAAGSASVASAGAGSAPDASAGSSASFLTGDWPTFDYDSARSGAARASGITAANAGQLTLRTVRIDGVADSAAVELQGVMVNGRSHDVFVVDTSYGRTIAIDPATGRRLWEFYPRAVNSTPGYPQVTTSTPTVDPSRRYVYSASPNGVIHKLSVATGRQVWARSITFDARHEKVASALSVSGRYVVAETGGYYGDAPPYDGHVVMIDRASGRIAHVWNTECSHRHRLIRAASCPVTNTRGDDAIWGRAGAVIEPGTGRILVATGNGPFDGHTAWGDSVLELTRDASRLLHNWTPTNQAALSGADLDVGSTSPALLPVYHGFHLAVQGGKDSRLALLNVARLDGTAGPASARTGGELQTLGAPGGDLVYTAPAVATIGANVYVFVATESASAAYTVVGGSHPQLRQIWQHGTGGTSPVLSDGLLYVYDEQNGALKIIDPVTGAQIRSLTVPTGHWNSPIVVAGRIILPTGSYHSQAASSTIAIYHLPGR